MDGVKIPLTFRIYKGDQLLRTETLTQPVIKVGKLSSSHLRIDDESVSRMHAVIEVTGPGEISIIDLGSTKGTIVNGQKVNKAKLQDGDVVVLGDTRIVLAVGEPEASDDVPTTVQESPALRAPGPADVVASTPRPAPAPSTPPPMASAPPPSFAAPPAPPAGGFAAPPPAGFPGARPVAAPAPMASAPPPQFGADAIEDVGGPRAIEVAAMLSDSVVAVKHITDPKGGKVTGTTYACFGLAAACFVMAIVAFQHGVSVARENKENLHLFTEGYCEVGGGRKAMSPADCAKAGGSFEAPRPAVDFRPHRLSPAWDAMAFLGLGGGLILSVFAVARSLDEKKTPYFRIGRAKGVEFPTETLPVEEFALVAPQGNDFVFSWTQGMRGEMQLDGKITPLEQLPTTGPIPHKARIRVETGMNTFLVSSVPAPRRQTGAILSSLDSAMLAYFGGTAVIMLGIVFMLKAMPPDRKSLALDVLSNDGRLNKVQVKPPEDPKQEEDKSQEKDDGEQSGGTGTKQALDEGKMGKKESDRQAGQYAIKNQGVDPQLAKAQRIEQATKAGVLGVIRSDQGSLFASITGTGDFSSGIDDRDVQGGLWGNEVGEMQGGYGFGMNGVGPGGGGTGLGTIGTGRYGTMGHGSGTGTGYGVGSGKGGMKGRAATLPKVNIGNATATGDLDKNIIRRYIRQKLPQIEYCYQKQLTVKANLEGTITTQFTINGNGAVISVKASGMGDPTVESCVADAIRSIQFPKPTGGGFVNVTYPFTFKAAGQ
jgi:pSer/pThr/pTyr-binding forkhead associated (FHA) protein